MSERTPLTDYQRLSIALEWANRATKAIFQSPGTMEAFDLAHAACLAYAISMLNFMVNMSAQVAINDDVSQKKTLGMTVALFLDMFERLIDETATMMPENGEPIKLGEFTMKDGHASLYNILPYLSPNAHIPAQPGSVMYRGIEFIFPAEERMPPDFTIEAYVETLIEAGQLKELPDGSLYQGDQFDDGDIILTDNGGTLRQVTDDEMESFAKNRRRKMN